MFKAKCNFRSGKAFQFKKGETVSADPQTIERLLREGLIEVVAGISAEADKPALRVEPEVVKEEPEVKAKPEKVKGKKQKG